MKITKNLRCETGKTNVKKVFTYRTRATINRGYYYFLNSHVGFSLCLSAFLCKCAVTKHERLYFK